MIQFDNTFVVAARNLTIGAELVEGAGSPLDVLNPATEKVLATVGLATVQQADRAVSSARAGFEVWRKLTPNQRSRLMHSYADLIERARDELVATIVNEVGSPVSLVEAAQAELPVGQLRWFADAAARDRVDHLGPALTPPPTVSQISYRPVGVVVAISAYNYPLTIAALKLGAALAAGCSVVLMPSPRAPLTALRLGELALQAGLPPGVVNVVVGNPEIGRHLVAHPDTDKVSFTGSVPVGADILATASSLIKGVTLELGGKGPAIFFEDADMSQAVADAHLRWSRNAGQVCTAPTRLLVHESMKDEFVEASASVFERLVVGDPWRRETVIGPLITPEHRDRVQSYVDGALAAGGEVLVAGRAELPDTGWYLNPVLFGGLPEDARAVQEEIFGPVAVLQTFTDERDAIRIANSTPFGLSAAVYTADLERAMSAAESLRAGTVWINGGGSLRPDAVFGGFGMSGLGREQGEQGIMEFLEPQHVQWRVPS
jgi:aldehyde dehydrogenase (NAD+)/betaine-aldehyde dehydrogenase